MAAIKHVPPMAVIWQLTITEDERGYLLAAFDFARSFLSGDGLWSQLTNEWPLPAEHYAREIGHLEQVVASVNGKVPPNA